MKMLLLLIYYIVLREKLPLHVSLVSILSAQLLCVLRWLVARCCHCQVSPLEGEFIELLNFSKDFSSNLLTFQLVVCCWNAIKRWFCLLRNELNRLAGPHWLSHNWTQPHIVLALDPRPSICRLLDLCQDCRSHVNGLRFVDAWISKEATCVRCKKPAQWGGNDD